jgi:23S rRNA pseudouridine1911/1915/1917 synthase
MQHLQAPIVGDPVYGIRGIIPHRFMTDVLFDAVQGFKRQALHAIRLGLVHPASGQPMEWQIDLPADMKLLLEAMRHEDPVTDEAFAYEMLDEDDAGDEYLDGDDLDEDEDLE